MQFKLRCDCPHCEYEDFAITVEVIGSGEEWDQVVGVDTECPMCHNIVNLDPEITFDTF